MTPPNNIFKSKINVSLDSQVMSDSVILSDSGILSPVSPNVIVYKNDIETTGSILFVSGDSIKLKITSSAQYADQSHGIVQITIDNNTDYHIFTCVTISEIRKVPEFADLEPFELIAYPDGSEYIPKALGNRLVSYEEIEDGAISTLLGFDSLDNIASSVEETDSIIICSFFTRKVYRINLYSGEIQGIIGVSGRPYGAIGIPKVPGINNITDLWVTLADENRVIVLDNTDQIIREFSVGSRPLGIATNSDYTNVWVANSYDNTVTHFKWDLSNLDWDITTLNVGEKPFEIACDIDNNAWVTCAADDKVYKITENDVVNSFVVGLNPRGIAYNSNKIWVAISQEEKVVALDLSGNIVHTLENIGIIPFAIGAVGLPISYRSNLFDVINIAERLITDPILDVVSIQDVISNNILVDNFVTIESISSNGVIDTITFSESLNVTLNGGGEPPGPTPTTVDANYRYVVLHINGES